jgi:hypothetical protein
MRCALCDLRDISWAGHTFGSYLEDVSGEPDNVRMQALLLIPQNTILQFVRGQRNWISFAFQICRELNLLFLTAARPLVSQYRPPSPSPLPKHLY